MDLHYLSIMELSRELRSRSLSPVEVTHALLSRIDQYDLTYASFITILADRSIARARQAEDELSQGFWRGPLHGVPIALKDMFATSYAPTSEGMFMQRKRNLTGTATVVERLEQAGAIIVGKLSMTQAAFGADDPLMPLPKNPWNTDYWTGASSSGPGVATAAGFCYGALATDSGGSIRLPSAANGLTGIKPTWGRVSRYGVCEQSPSLDHIGPIARNVADAAALLGAIAGPDQKDPTASLNEVPDYLEASRGSIAGVRIGLDEEWVFANTDPDIQAAIQDAIQILVEMGAVIVRIRFPDQTDALSAWANICAAEAARAHEGRYPEMAAGYSSSVASLLEGGLHLSAKTLSAGYVARDIFKGRVAGLFRQADVLICPVLPVRVPTVARWNDIASGLIQGEFEKYISFTASFDVTGSPALAIPGGVDRDGLPIGLQLVGAHFSEPLLFRLGQAFQSRTGWHAKHPALQAS
jgi:amidase